MELVRLQLDNFLSFKRLDHHFIKEPVLIKGKNLTEESKENNGAGKSTMLSGIAFALLADSLRGKTLDKDLILWGGTEAEVQLDIHCPIRNETLSIHRTIRTKGSSTLNLTINDKPVQYATVNDGNNYILEWVGISAADIKGFFLLNKENYKPFIRCSNTDRLALINRFIKADRLTESDETIKKYLTPLTAKKERLMEEVAGYRGEVQAYEAQLEAEKTRDFEAEKAERATTIENSIAALLDKYDASEQSIANYNKEIDGIRAQLGKKQAILEEIKDCIAKAQEISFEADYNAINEDSKALMGQFNSYSDKCTTKKRELYSCEQELNRLTTILGGAITCPHCGGQFLLDNNAPIEELRAKVTDIEGHKKEIADEIQLLGKTIKDVEEQLATFTARRNEVSVKEMAHNKHLQELTVRLNDANRVVDMATNQINGLLRKIDFEENAKKDYNHQIDTLEAQMVALDNETPTTRVEEITGILSIKNKQLNQATERLDECVREIANYTRWGLIFKEFRMKLACEQLKLIQDIANLSLQRQKSELRIVIEGFKANRKGEIKSEINVLVIDGKGDSRSYWSFSGGERCRVDIAIIQAFQEMINSTNKWGGLHFLMVDEVLEGTDPLGLFLLMESLQEWKQSVYIISHVMQIRAGIATFTVAKENGISYIE